MVRTLTNEGNIKTICQHLIDQTLKEESEFKSYLLRIILNLVKKYPFSASVCELSG